MRKFLACAVGAIVLFGSAGLTACGGASARTSYDIRAEYLPEEGKLKAEMTVTVPNPGETALESLSFELWPNAYREGAKYAPVSDLYAPAAYYAGKSYGGITVSSVEGAAGFGVSGEDENILSVTLSEPLYPDEETTIAMTFEVTLAKINHRLGIGEHNVNLAGFYPVLCARGQSGWLEYVYSPSGDPFVSECADYTVALTVPEDYKIACACAGEAMLSGGKKTFRANAENVRDIAFVLGKELNCLKDEADGVTLEYWYRGDKAPETAFKAAKDSLAYFSRTFGGYAYPRYVVVETDFPYGGMEYTGLSMISSSLVAKDVPAVVAHETAHQWWYAMVGSNQFENAWQDEGLAEYSAALFLGAYPEYGDTYENCIKRSEEGFRAFFSVRSQLSGEADTTMNRPLTSYSGDYEYRNIAYDKGVILLDRVRLVLGDRKFFSGLKNYVSSYSGRIASPEDFISCFSGNAEELFRSFTEGKCVI